MTFLNRLSINAISLMAYLALGISSSLATPYYSHSDSSTNTTAAAITLQATTIPEQSASPPAPVVKTTRECVGSSQCTLTTTTTTTAADGTVTTTTDVCHSDSSFYDNDCGVSPTEGNLTVQNLSASLSHTQMNIAASASLRSSEQKMHTTGIALNYSRDIGDWSYAIALPIRRTDNNSPYQALDNTQIGVVFTPTYHLFLEQVHGLGINLGGVVGYTHTNFSDVGALRASPYNLTDFSNLDTSFAGLNASLVKQLSPLARLNLSVNAMAYNNDGGVSMGNKGSVVNSTAGLNFLLTEKLTAGAKFNAIRLHQSSFNSTSSFHSLGGNLRYTIDRRSSLTGSFDTTVGSENLDIKTYMLNYQLEM
jgi:hypothetical protein